VRHLRSIMYALVLAPTVWALCGVGFAPGLTIGARPAAHLTGLLVLLLAGAVYAVLLLPRLSPAGPAGAGLVFLALSGWDLLSPDSLHSLWPPAWSPDGVDLTMPGNGLAVLLAAPLLGTALDIRRWRAPAGPALPPAAPAALDDSAQTTAVRPAAPAGDLAADPTGGTTQIVAPSADNHPSAGEPTQLLVRSGPGEQTQVIAHAGPGEQTQLIARAGAGEQTQLISPAGPGEQTQVISPAGPGETTTIIAVSNVGEATVVLRPVHGAEQLEPVMTVLGVERPPDEAADDTVRLRAGPVRRKPKTPAVPRQRAIRDTASRRAGDADAIRRP
jgi:hypothetical protein